MLARFRPTPTALLFVLIFGGCAAPSGKPSGAAANLPSSSSSSTSAAATADTAINMPAITYIVPTNAAYVAQNGTVNDLKFGTFDTGPRVDHEMLTLKREGQTLIVERKRANSSNIGSAVVYRVGTATQALGDGYKVELKPISVTSYKEGLILSFGLPSFTEADLTAFLLTPMLHYRIEIDSQFNSESTFANLKRLLKSRSFATGERDPVTNKIFTQQFLLPYRGKDVLLTAEAFPYRNGSKVVMNLRLPAVFTSPNTVDYNVVLDEVTRKLREVVAA